MLRDVPKFWIAVLALLGIACTTYSVVGIYYIRLEQRRQAGMQEVMASAQPIITALRTYQKRYGKPPENLQALQQPFPQPGTMAKNGWEYSPRDMEWTLAISVSADYTQNWSGGDIFRYCSDGKSFAGGDGGELERIGEWGYSTYF